MSRFILDCDPGHDDAVALLVAARHLTLVGVTTVFGNSTVDNTTRNALAIVEAAGLDVPVARGAGAPLAGRIHMGESVHGQSGLDGASFPDPRGRAHSFQAVEFIIDAADRYDDLAILAIAPLTNIATALDAEPSLAGKIKAISIMGGSTGSGNATPAAEFNIFADPEAAARVFSAGIPLTMAGLNVTATFGVRADDIGRLRRSASLVARELGGALAYYLERQASLYGRDYAPLHDVCAVLPFSHPGLVSHIPMHVGVECNGELTRGMTVCDQRGMAHDQGLQPAAPPNALVATTVRADDIIAMVLDTLLDFP